MKQTFEYHRFLDEAGDTTFFGKGKTPIIGKMGFQNHSPLEWCNSMNHREMFEIGLLYCKIAWLQTLYIVMGDSFFMPRRDFFDFIKTVDCSFQIVVGRKDISRFVNKHNNKEPELYN